MVLWGLVMLLRGLRVRRGVGVLRLVVRGRREGLLRAGGGLGGFAVVVNRAFRAGVLLW